MAAFEVIALDTATPQLRAPGASDTYTFPRAVEMPLGTANGVLYLNGSKVVTSGSGLVFDSSGNLGLGVTPSGWGSVWKAQQLQVGAFVASQTNADDIIHIGTNAFANSSNLWTYINTAAATRYQQYQGAHSWHTAPSGTAGNAISFSQVMTLDASGNLGVGTTSPANLLHINGSNSIARFSGASTSLSAYQTFFNNSAAQAYFGIESSTGTGIIGTGAAYGMVLTTASTNPLVFGTNNTERARIPAAGGMVVGTAALATTATDGFLYVPTCAGTPTGTPTTQTGTAPIVVDTTNNKLYFYSGGQWRDAGP